MLRGSPVILREVAVDLSETDYSDGEGFYFHTTAGGVICYLPFSNDDEDTITKTFDATDSYTRAVFAKKIIKATTTATGIYAGKG